MLPVRRGVAHAARLQSQRLLLRARTPLVGLSYSRQYSITHPREQNVFHSQLESTPNAADLLASMKSAAPTTTPQTLTEKIVQQHSAGLAPGKIVKAGDYVTLQPKHCMSHDNTAPVASKFRGLGAKRIYNNRQTVFTIDHDVSNRSEANLKKYKGIAELAAEQGVDFYPAGRGIGHQIMVESGYAWPGTLCVASDSHSNHYGAVGCLGTAVVRTDAASIWATGKTWWQVPPQVKVTFTGVLPKGTTGKDVIVALCALFSNDEVLNHAIEFAGSEQTLSSIPIEDRMSISNMTTEWGALTGLFPIDSTLISWLRAKATTAAMLDLDASKSGRVTHERIDELLENQLTADPGATYAKEFYMNLSTLQPYVSGPNSVKIATPVRDLEAQNIAIDKAYLISCTNSRATDIAAAARVFKEAGKDGVPAKIAPSVQFFLAAASTIEQKAAEEAGDWQVLVDAGATVLPSGCATCIGLGPGLLLDGEVGLSSSNRNYKSRLGSSKAKAYLSSPEVVAASAIQGKIAGTGWYEKPEGVEKVIIGEGSGDYVADKALSIEDALDKIIAQAESMIAASESDVSGSGESSATPATGEGEETLTEVRPGFPETISGELLFLDADNLNTDGIFGGKYTYRDDLTTQEMADVCMENYDPEFRNTAREGDIIVAGFNFGCGSSREQAATSILAKGIPLVVSGSFGNIFSRNSINNALLGVEVPRLIERLRETFKNDPKVATRRTGWKLTWDVRRSKVTVTEASGETWSQKVGEMPPNVQEIIARGGLEKWVKAEISK